MCACMCNKQLVIWVDVVGASTEKTFGIGPNFISLEITNSFCFQKIAQWQKSWSDTVPLRTPRRCAEYSQCKNLSYYCLPVQRSLCAVRYCSCT